MCFGSSQPAAPPPAPVLPPPVAPQPPAPVRATAPAKDLTIDRQSGVKKKESSKEASGLVSKGTSQLRVPLNIGAPKSGGLNI